MRYLRRAVEKLRSFVGGLLHPITPLPPLEEGFSYVLYRWKTHPSQGMLCVKGPDGMLVPVHRRFHAMNRWVPADDWTIENESLTGGNS